MMLLFSSIMNLSLQLIMNLVVMNINNWKIPEKNFGEYFKDTNVVTRFPPEPSGYLHLGHVKALCINYVLAKKYSGRVLLRFDDTNPKNETQEYEDAIFEDIEMLGFEFDSVTHTSDFFDVIIAYANKLVNMGKAYVDLSNTDEIKESRLTGKTTKYRNTSIQDNIKLWNEMQNGNSLGILRIKLNMKHKNNTLRDPTIFRSLNHVHYRTGNKYKVYPSYDFSCPIVDHMEGVTHVLRSTEFADHDIQYTSILEELGLIAPKLFSYGKVNMEGALMSKRLIKDGISNGTLSGWNDPSLYTIRGLLRRGMTDGGLFDFIATLGFTKNTVNMKPNKLWATNKRYVDILATRINGLKSFKKLVIPGLTRIMTIPRYYKNPLLGDRELVLTNTIFVADGEDVSDTFGLTLVNDLVINNLVVDKLVPDQCNKIISKIVWIPDDYVIITVRTNNGMKVEYFVEPFINEIKKGDYIQIYKAGYYICDDDVSKSFIEVPVGTEDILS